MELGTLKTNHVHLQEHEYHTVRILLESGYDVELIPPSRIQRLPTPDIMLCGLPWEIKAPQGDGKHVIKHTFQNAARQSENLIIDLIRCGLPENRALREIEHHYKLSRRIRRLKVVTRNEKVLDF